MSNEPKHLKGNLIATDLKIGIAVSRFNSLITEKLLEGALDTIERTGGSVADTVVAWTPGAFELPGAVRRLCDSGRFDAVIALGAVIRGATPHFGLIAAEVTKGLGYLQTHSDVAVSFGVLTPDTIEQAIERAGTKAGNKGAEAALAAIETANLYRALKD